MTVSRWERQAVKMTLGTLEAVAKALDDRMEGEDLYYHPDRPSPNQLLRDQPPDVLENVMKMIMAIRK